MEKRIIQENEKKGDSISEEMQDVTERSSEEKSRAERLKKTVIIVGASSGIGYETALRLIGRNFKKICRATLVLCGSMSLAIRISTNL